MESKVIHSHVHEYEELHPHVEAHDDEHDENKSVLKKVKAKAKKIKEKIKNHGHHDDHEHIPDDHDLDEEEDDDEPEVHGAPIYESSVNRGSVVGGEEEPRVVVVNLEKPTGLVEDPDAPRSSLHPHTTSSDYHTKLTDPTQPGVFPLPGAAEADIEPLETSFTTMNVHHDQPKPKPRLSQPCLPSETKPRTGIHDQTMLEDHHNPASILQPHTASNYQTKLTHPPQLGVSPLPDATEIDIEPLQPSFATMNVSPSLPSESKPRTGIYDQNVTYPSTTTTTHYPSEQTHYEPIPKPPTFSSATENVVVPSTTIATHQDYKSTDVDSNLDDFPKSSPPSFGIHPIQKPPNSTSYDDPIFPAAENVVPPTTRSTTHDYKSTDIDDNLDDFSKSSTSPFGVNPIQKPPLSTNYDDPIFPADENVVPPTTKTTTHEDYKIDDANVHDFSKSSYLSGGNPISTSYDNPIFPAAENLVAPTTRTTTHEDYKTDDANVDDFSKSSYLSGGNPIQKHYEPIQKQPNPTNLDKVTTSTTTKDRKTKDFDADADVNVNYYSKSSSLGENPIQKQPNPTKDHMTEDADDNVIASTKLSSSGATPTEYGKKIAESVTEKLAPFYGKVAGLGDAVKCKVVSNSSNVGYNGNNNNNGVSVKDYLVEKLRPGDEDKALSEVISEVLHNKQNEHEGTTERETEEKNRVVLGKVTESEVKRRLGSDDDGEGEKSDKWMVDKIKGVVGSWFGKPDQENQSSQAEGGSAVSHDITSERRLQESSN